MSAVQKPATVDQLARALSPHKVLVHHDFSQTPDFSLKQPNVLLVPDPKRTGWAFFGFVDGIFHSLRYALDTLDFDYLQLLSPTCLPIKPMRQFEAHVSGAAEAHADCIDLLADRDALMSVGYRAFTPEGSLRHRVARKLSREYFSGSTARRDLAGVWLRSGFAANRNGNMTLRARFALAFTRALSNPAIGRHIFSSDLRPFYGTTWFGARRHIVSAMVDEFSRTGVRDYFSRLFISDEFLIPTLLKRIGARLGPMNHYIHTFDEAHAGWIKEDEFDILGRSPAFFARKFADDPGSPIRLRVLNNLVGMDRELSPGIPHLIDAASAD